MVELISHASNSIFRKNPITEGFPKSGHIYSIYITAVNGDNESYLCI